MRWPRRKRHDPVPFHPDYTAMGAFWMADDEELQAMIERLAVTSKARGPEIGYLLAESDRRALRRANDAMVKATEEMAHSAKVTGRLTLALVILTLALVGLTATLILIDAGAL